MLRGTMVMKPNNTQIYAKLLDVLQEMCLVQLYKKKVLCCQRVVHKIIIRAEVSVVFQKEKARRKFRIFTL
ncbi:hypothetical protein TNIN_369351 [Trichonephila inaurata madagascariensis]|uniref:Uncharacterized protein n=1 Tax=Trichonephila inaurata madagascariensis TaxID=2747483 RepID=A0A8X7CHD1_9ARAC|nr:hypothetical protein TNIN_369351 [Trichonephila inaurata madagascariensis]